MSDDAKLLISTLVIVVVCLSYALYDAKQELKQKYRLQDCANQNHRAADNMHVSIDTAKDLAIEIEKSLFLVNLNDRKSMLDTLTEVSQLKTELQESLDNDYYFDSCD